jgi:WD40 repeat protein
MNCGDVCIKLP